MLEHHAGIDIDRVPAGRLDDRQPGVRDMATEICRGGDPIFEVFVLKHFLQSNCDRVQITSSESTVGWKPFGQDQEICLFLRKEIIVCAEESAYVRERVFLCRKGAAISQRKHLASDLFRCLIRVPGFSLLDEPCVLCESTSVEIQRNTVSSSDLADRSDIRHRDRLAAA